jgi:hypothetical protein
VVGSDRGLSASAARGSAAELSMEREELETAAACGCACTNLLNVFHSTGRFFCRLSRLAEVSPHQRVLSHPSWRRAVALLGIIGL